MQFKVDGMLIPLTQPALAAAAALEFMTHEQGVQFNVLDRSGSTAQIVRVEFNERGELEMNVWIHDRNPHTDDPWESITLLWAEETREAE